MDFFTNILSGGLLGTVTSLFSTWFKIKEQREANEFKLKMIKANSDASIREIEANVKVEQILTEGKILLEENKADTVEVRGRSSMLSKLTGKYISDETLHIMLSDNSLVGRIFKPLIYIHLLFMDALRGLVRPLLTVGIVGYVAFIIQLALEKYLLDDFSNEELMLMVIKPSIALLLFSASTIIAFWFADKSMSRRFQKNF